MIHRLKLLLACTAGVGIGQVVFWSLVATATAFAQGPTQQVSTSDYTALLTAIGSGGGGALSIYLAYRWVQQVVADRLLLETQRVAEAKQQRDEYAALLRMVLEAIKEGH